MTSETFPLVLHGRRRTSVRLRGGTGRDGMTVWEAGGVRRRIPVAAMERVDVHGTEGRRLTIVLTGDAPVAYRLECRSAPAVDECAHAVRRALPVRDTDEPRPDGAELVSEEPLERAEPNGLRALLRGLAGGYVLVFVLLVAKGVGPVPVLLWAVAPLAIGGGGFGVYVGGAETWVTWVLRTRGIAVEGRLQQSRWYEDSKRYAYIDHEGVRRECGGSAGDGERAEITYDSANPGTAEVGRRPRGVLVFHAAITLVFGPILLAVAQPERTADSTLSPTGSGPPAAQCPGGAS